MHKVNSTGKISLLPLAIIHQGRKYNNHLLTIENNRINIHCFESECENTKFISAIIIISKPQIFDFFEKLQLISDPYKQCSEIIDFYNHWNLFVKNDEEPVFLCADSSGYRIMTFD